MPGRRPHATRQVLGCAAWLGLVAGCCALLEPLLTLRGAGHAAAGIAVYGALTLAVAVLHVITS